MELNTYIVRYKEDKSILSMGFSKEEVLERYSDLEIFQVNELVGDEKEGGVFINNVKDGKFI